MRKLWSYSTTVRNPERIRDFLRILKEIEGIEWTRPNQKKFQVLLIKNRLYGYGNTQFYNSLPNRFLFAFTGGIPIIMPEGYFLSCQEIIKKYQIGFTYKDVEDLRSKIKNKHLMEKIKENAIKISSDFTFEKNFHKLEKFMKNLNQ